MRTLALGLLVLLPGVGCFHLQPVGPFAKELTKSSDSESKPAPGVTVTPPKDAAAGPVVQPAPAPPPPALLVTPGEVTETNYRQATQRLMEELEADRKSMDAMPRTAEVSVVNGGR
jgi:hypothetical protein